MYNKEWHQKYYLENKEKKIKYQKDKYHETHDIKPRSFSEEEFQQRLKENYGDNFETLTPHINSKSKIKVKCKKCGNEWTTLSGSLLRGRGCKKCHTLTQKRSNDNFLEKFAENYGGKYELLSDYINANEKVKVKCNTCDNIWETKAYHFIHTKSGCPKCASENRGLKSRKTHEEFLNEINNKFPKKFEVIGQYIKASQKLEIKCNTCNNNWNIAPNTLLSGIGCPICNQSKGESKIKYYLDINNIIYVRQKTFEECRNIQVLQFDFYLPDQKICIEYDGVQHFKPIEHFGGEERLKYTIENDKIKNNFCKENKIKMIRIPYTQLGNIEKILTEKLKASI
jgi:very-short-patch-repair endonuclease/ribosomal protein S27E